jgi:glutaredoxin 3
MKSGHELFLPEVDDRSLEESMLGIMKFLERKKKEVDQAMAESYPANVKLYTTPWCPYCIRAKSLLKRKGVTFEDIDVSRQPNLRREMTELTGRTSVPQIFINEEPIGGCDDLHALEAAGRLEPLLAETPS